MSANRRRGEVAAELDGRVRKLCLTLGALAELEAAYAADDLGALVARFSRGSLSALDLMRIIAAGLTDARTVSPVVFGPAGTYNAFDIAADNQGVAIDHVFIGDGLPLIARRHRHVPLELQSADRFADGVVRLHYRVQDHD